MNKFVSRDPLVSVIVPAFNGEQYIEQTLDSVLSQTYEDLEVLVVDDGSQDGTARIVRAIQKRDKRVALLQQTNCGVGAARNLAIQKSRGEYIAPIDADDIWFPQKIEKQVQCMSEAGPDTGLVYTWTASIDEDGSFIGGCRHLDLEGDVFGALIINNLVGCASVPLIRRICIEAVGGYNTEWKDKGAQGCEDWDLYLRIAEHYQFCLVKETLVGYRRTATNMSLNHRDMEKSHLLVLEDLQRRNPGIPAFFCNWSQSYFCLYLNGQAARCGDFWPRVGYLYKAARQNYVFLLYSDFLLKIPRLAKWLCASLVRTLLETKFSTGAFRVLRKITVSEPIRRGKQTPKKGLAVLRQSQLCLAQQLVAEMKSRENLGLNFENEKPRKEYAVGSGG